MSARFFDIAEAQANLSELIDAAVAGEEIVIAREGRRLVKMIRYDEPSESSMRNGFASDPTLIIPDDFDDPLPDDVMASFTE